MNDQAPNDTSQLSLLELFIGELETQTTTLTAGLLELERAPQPAEALQALMRAAHSIKGAARIVSFHSAVKVAHAMEDCFVAAQDNHLSLDQKQIDVLLRSVDLLTQLARRTEKEINAWEIDCAQDINRCLEQLNQLATSNASAGNPAPPPAATHDLSDESELAVLPWQNLPVTPSKRESTDRTVRLTAESLNRLLGLAGESLVESRWLRPFTDSLQRLKTQHVALAAKLDSLRHDLDREKLSEQTRLHFNDLFTHFTESRRFLAERVQELDVFDHRSAQLSHRLYLEVLRTRMRPFGDGVRRFPRMVRDLARSLGKTVHLEINGDSTQVDRDILERLEMPLAHLLRNAVDHGCQNASDRLRAGKCPENTVRLEARHSAGMLIVAVSDDGCGVDVNRLRNAIVQKGLAQPALVSKLSDSDLLEFLFLPGFTLKDTVSEISGRGVGLDVVQNMVRSVRGAIRLQNHPARGLRIQLQLPLTLSVLRALLVQVDREPYAIPLSQIQRTLKIPRNAINSLAGRPHFQLGGQHVRLLTAHQVLDCGAPSADWDELCVVVLGDRSARYGLVVDSFLGERELVVQPLDPRLGKVNDISAAALMEDGAPVLIVDVDDVLHSMERLAAGDSITWSQPQPTGQLRGTAPSSEFHQPRE